MVPFRNHPIVLVKNVIAYLVLGLSLMFVMGPSAFLLTFALVMLSVLWWLRTLYYFEETELHVVRDTVFKNDTHIQYSKLATVDVRRSLLDRLAGTAMLSFTINSAVNPNVSEASLTLKQDIALKLRDELSEKVFNKSMTVEEDMNIPSEVKVSNLDIVLYAVFGQSSLNVLWGFAFLLFSLFSAWNGELEAFVGSITMLVVTNVIPWVTVILRYCNYRIYRVADTITVESGLISTYRTSFKINKINSVGIRETFFAKLMGRAILEAEVVGVADSTGRPVLCPLKPKSDVERLFRTIVPEFVVDMGNAVSQPRSAMVPMVMYNLLYTVPFMVAGILAYMYLDLSALHPSWTMWEPYALVVEFLLVVGSLVLAVAHAVVAQRERSFAMADDMFLFVHGAFDSVSQYINYDKVQMVDVSSSPLSRRFGLSRCMVAMMSSMGFRGFTSGYFPTEVLEKVGAEVMSRIKDGRYDHRRYY